MLIPPLFPFILLGINSSRSVEVSEGQGSRGGGGAAFVAGSRLSVRPSPPSAVRPGARKSLYPLL